MNKDNKVKINKKIEKQNVQDIENNTISKIENKNLKNKKFCTVPLIEVSNLTKRYKIFKNDAERAKALFFKNYKKEKLALDDISFVINEGESVAFLGKNGAGKSTLSKLIAGVAIQTSGRLIIRQRVTALLELTAGFDPFYTGRENIYLKANFMNIEKKVIDKYIDEIINFADLNEFIDVQIRKYSSGMIARLGFAFNVCIEPEILLVDEALSVGDENFSQKCLLKIQEILANSNVTFILVTHSMEMAKNFCKRGIVLENSKIAFDGPIKQAVNVYHEINKKSMKKLYN